MKDKVQVLILVVLLGLVVAEVMRYRHSEQQIGLLRLEMDGLEQRLAAIEEDWEVVGEAVKQLEDESVSAIMEDAGEAISEGWSSMLDAIEQGLKQAQEEIKRQRERENDSNSKEQQAAPAEPEKSTL